MTRPLPIALALLLILPILAFAQADADGGTSYDAETIAFAPDRWHIEGLAYYGGTVAAGTAYGVLGHTPIPIQNVGEASRIYLWDRTTGDLQDTLDVPNEDTMSPHGVAGVLFDDVGRLYALHTQFGLTRWTDGGDSWSMETIVPIPDLPACWAASAPCSPTLIDQPALGNDLTWGPDGALYVTDSHQATVWRIGADASISIWFQHADLDRTVGANGLRVSPDGTRMLVAITGPDSIAIGPIDRAAVVFSIPFPDPSAAPHEVFFTLPNGDLADGIAYGAEGDLYVASNAGNRIFIVAPDGTLARTIENADLVGDAVMDFPASLGFDGAGALLVTNYAWVDGNVAPQGRSIIAIDVDDVGAPVPTTPGID